MPNLQERSGGYAVAVASLSGFYIAAIEETVSEAEALARHLAEEGRVSSFVFFTDVAFVWE
ncbi:MAG: hypothetical protein ACT4QC_07325 [Planctomycetaceae bacterium]